jgi:hypothetical protein
MKQWVSKTNRKGEAALGRFLEYSYDYNPGRGKFVTPFHLAVTGSE